VYLYYRDIVEVYKKLTGRDFETKDLYEAVLSKVKRPSLQRRDIPLDYRGA